MSTPGASAAESGGWEEARRVKRELVEGRVEAWLARAEEADLGGFVGEMYLLGPTVADMRAAEAEAEARGGRSVFFAASSGGGGGRLPERFQRVPLHGGVGPPSPVPLWLAGKVDRLLEQEIKAHGLMGLEDVDQNTDGLTFEDKIELVAQHRLLCRVMAPPTSSPSTPPPPPPQERDLGDSKKMYCLRVTARGFLSLEPFVVVAAAAPHGLSYDQLLDQLEGVAEPYARFSRCGEGVTEAAQATSGKSSAAAEAPREEETETGDLSDGVSLDSDDFFDGEVPLSPGDKRWSYCLAEAQQRRGPESAVLHYEFAPLLTTQDAERIWGAAGEGKKPVFIRTGELERAKQIAGRQAV